MCLCLLAFFHHHHTQCRCKAIQQRRSCILEQTHKEGIVHNIVRHLSISTLPSATQALSSGMRIGSRCRW